jgi:predicted permease
VFYLLGQQYPESVPGAWVTPGYVGGFGVRATLGRTLEAADFAPGSPSVALISYQLWQSRYGGVRDVIGRTFNAYVSDRPDQAEMFTIVGVLPQDFWHLNLYTEVLAPLKAPSYPYMARLRSGVAPEVATERIARHVRNGLGSAADGFDIRLTSTQGSYAASVRPVLWSVAAAATLVLLIATANVAVLSIMRGRRREREFAVRLAMGANPRRLARLLALEGVLVGAVSVALALFIAHFVLPFLAPLIEQSLDRRLPGGFDALHVDAWVTSAALAAGAMVTFVLATVPLVTLNRHGLSVGLAGSPRGATDSARTGRSRTVLIAVEVAASLTLMVGAALMGESALRMLRVDFGIDPAGVMTAGLGLRQGSYPDASSQVAFFDRLSIELPQTVGGSAIALGEYWPLQPPRPRPVETSGSPTMTAGASRFVVSANYFEALGIPIRDGRGFDVKDRVGSEPVVVVSATLAGHLWPRARAVGQPLILYPDEGPPIRAMVVGVAEDVRQSHTDIDFFDTYLPLAQRGSRFAFLYVSSDRVPFPDTAIRSAVSRIDPEVAVGAFRPLESSIEQERARPQFMAYLLTTFAGFAGVLALVGMHGVIAYAVRQRQREIAVRMAVGATASAVTGMFLREGSVLLAAGLASGIAGAVALGQVLESQLYGVEAAEPRVLGAAELVFGFTALVAMLGPALRAARTAPALVLKEE